MINHITLFVNDIEKSKKFYQKALEPLGYKVVEEDSSPEGDKWVGFAINDQEGDRDFWIKYQDGKQSYGALSCLAFTAKSKKMVDDFYEAAMAIGGVDNGEPGYRPKYHDGYYAAFILDPDENNIEAVFDDLPNHD